MIDEIHRVTHSLGMEGPGDLVERGVVAVAQERAAQRGRELVDLRRRKNRKCAHLRLVDPVILAEQQRAARNWLAGKEAASHLDFADFEQPLKRVEGGQEIARLCLR